MPKEKNNMKPYIKNRMWIFAGALILIFVYKTDFSKQIARFFKVMHPVIIAILIAWLLLPLKIKTEKKIKSSFKDPIKRHSHAIAAAIVYVLFFALIVLFMVYLIPIICEGISQASDKFSDYFAVISKYVNIGSPSDIINKINPEIYITGARTTVSFVINAGMTLVILIYVLLEHRELKSFAVSLAEILIGTDKTERLMYYFTKTNLIFSGYFYGKFISSAILGIIVTAGFFVIRTDYPIFFGITVALSNLIPIFGAIISAVPIAVTALAEHGFKKMLAAVLVIVAGQQIENNILTPKIVGSSMGLSGFWVLFSVTFGGGLFGFWGMFMSIPIAATVKMLYTELVLNGKIRIAKK